jgi:SagB-type dehydrogenase family enzyme
MPHKKPLPTVNADYLDHRGVSSSSMPLALLYHENSKLQAWDCRAALATNAIVHAPGLRASLERAFKSYSGSERIDLPDIDHLSYLEALIRQRHSTRSYQLYSIKRVELAHLLKFSYGVKPGVRPTCRAVPSGGALYPLELYPIVFRAADFPSGVYHYDARDHALELLNVDSHHTDFARHSAYPKIVSACSALIVITYLYGRVDFKYGEQGYRLALLEAGHVGQNIALLATELGLGSVSLSGIFDHEYEDLIGVDGINESIVYVIALGKPA